MRHNPKEEDYNSFVPCIFIYFELNFFIVESNLKKFLLELTKKLLVDWKVHELILFNIHCFRLMMNGKLFIVMGLSWIFEFIQVFTGPNPAWLWYVPDMFNSVHGVFIAAIYILKRRVLHALARRLGCIKTQPNATRGQVTSGVTSIRCQNPAQLKSIGSSSTLFTTISR